MHRRSGHQSSDKLFNLLRRDDIDAVISETCNVLPEIYRECHSFQTYAQCPQRFKSTLREDKDFNHTVYENIFYIDRKSVLHVADEATNYQAARWLQTVSTKPLWEALRLCWIDVYLGPPDVIAHDAGKNFMAEGFFANANLLDIRTKSIPIESANSMTIVERYHQPIRRSADPPSIQGHSPRSSRRPYRTFTANGSNGNKQLCGS